MRFNKNGIIIDIRPEVGIDGYSVGIMFNNGELYEIPPDDLPDCELPLTYAEIDKNGLWEDVVKREKLSSTGMQRPVRVAHLATHFHNWFADAIISTMQQAKREYDRMLEQERVEDERKRLEEMNAEKANERTPADEKKEEKTEEKPKPPPYRGMSRGRVPWK